MSEMECLSKMETSEIEDCHQRSENSVLPKKVPSKEEAEVKIVSSETSVKQELDETDIDGTLIDGNLSTNVGSSSLEQLDKKEGSLLGKLKTRSFALLAESMQQTPLLSQEDSVDGVPQAAVTFTFPHSHQMRPSAETPKSEHDITNNSFAEPHIYPRQVHFPDTPAAHFRPLVMHTPPQSASIMPVTTTNSIAILNSYVPLNIPSVRPKPISPTITVCSLSSVRNAIDPLGSNQRNVSLPLPSENGTTSSATDYQIKEEKNAETISPNKVPVIHSASANRNVIVKDELDLGVSTGDDHRKTNLNNMNNLVKHFLTSDSIFPCEDQVVDPYQDIDPKDLKPKSNPKGKRLCKVCDYRHSCPEAMEKHTARLHTEKYNYRCFICTTAAYIHKISPYKLRALKLPSFRALEHHVATVHRDKKGFWCEECDKKFKNKQAAKNHKSKVHKTGDPFACHSCSFTCKTLVTLETHRFTQHDDTPMECSVCLKMVKKSYISKHMTIHDPNRELKQKRKCVKCDFSTDCKAFLLRHYRRTSHDKEFHCEFCKYVTNFEDDFKNHFMTSCTKDNPYVCTFPGCDKKFYLKRAYVSHYDIHVLKRKVFRCADKDCDYETLVKYHLVRHHRKTKHHHAYKCPDCYIRYCNEKILASHIRRVHVENIIRERGLPLEVEDNDSNEAANRKATDVEVDGKDPYAHFMKGLFGMLADKESIPNQQSAAANKGPSSSSNAETQCDLLNDMPEFAHIVLVDSPMIECSNETSEFSGLTLCPGSVLLCNPPKIERGDEQNHMDVETQNCNVKIDPDSCENVLIMPSVLCPVLPSKNVDSGIECDNIKPDPDEVPYDSTIKSMEITPSIVDVQGRCDPDDEFVHANGERITTSIETYSDQIKLDPEEVAVEAD